MNTRACLPGVQHEFSWLEHPQGRRPGHVALWCCSAHHPLGQFGYSPAWFVKPLQSTEGNPLWRSCRCASSLAPQYCPALGGKRQLKQSDTTLPRFLPDTSVSTRFWICFKILEKWFGVCIYYRTKINQLSVINYQALICSLNFYMNLDNEGQQHWTHRCHDTWALRSNSFYSISCHRMAGLSHSMEV